MEMPPRIAFVDVETTGIMKSDRIVSIGIISLETSALLNDKISGAITHLIFDPGKKSHPKAEIVHGFDDWTLRHQEPFSKYADIIFEMISCANLVVAHNASFDLQFIQRELEVAGKERISTPAYCTMQAVRERGLIGSASLSSLCGRIGIVRQSQTHGALEDAWLAMQIFLLLHKCEAYKMPFSSVENSEIRNFRAPPPRPEGKLPRRGHKPAWRPEPSVASSLYASQ